MPTDQNGVLVYTDDETAPVRFQKLSVRSRFGFKLINAGGQELLEAATEEDYRNAEGQRLGIPPSEVEINYYCHSISGSAGVMCEGSCLNYLKCLICVQGAYLYCACS